MAKQRSVIVTGASSGIGRATAVRFAREGYRVCLNARREAVLRELADRLPLCCVTECRGVSRK
ncbi:MAG: SDR family NAD(P)-dependent oxidoreductase [Planctomycetia bacterium]|nr:SDR family NAD(P)-dependent oxidoreductase [Planctomycetia bacterium]